MASELCAPAGPKCWSSARTDKQGCWCGGSRTNNASKQEHAESLLNQCVLLSAVAASPDPPRCGVFFAVARLPQGVVRGPCHVGAQPGRMWGTARLLGLVGGRILAPRRLICLVVGRAGQITAVCTTLLFIAASFFMFYLMSGPPTFLEEIRMVGTWGSASLGGWRPGLHWLRRRAAAQRGHWLVMAERSCRRRHLFLHADLVHHVVRVPAVRLAQQPQCRCLGCSVLASTQGPPPLAIQTTSRCTLCLWAPRRP